MPHCSSLTSPIHHDESWPLTTRCCSPGFREFHTTIVHAPTFSRRLVTLHRLEVALVCAARLGHHRVLPLHEDVVDAVAEWTGCKYRKQPLIILFTFTETIFTLTHQASTDQAFLNSSFCPKGMGRKDRFWSTRNVPFLAQGRPRTPEVVGGHKTTFSGHHHKSTATGHNFGWCCAKDSSTHQRCARFTVPLHLAVGTSTVTTWQISCSPHSCPCKWKMFKFSQMKHRHYCHTQRNLKQWSVTSHGWWQPHSSHPRSSFLRP